MVRGYRRALGAVLGTVMLGGAPAAAEAARYVALGDSYSSGVGTRTYYDSTCQKSVYAYPYLLAQQRPDTQLVFAACGGATTSTVLSSQVGNLTSSTALVSITVGGNDAGFSNVIRECAEPSWSSNCNGAIDTAQAYIRNTLPAKLTNVYNQIKSRSPNAKVVVLGYPRIFMGVDCNAGTFFSADEMTRLNQTADLLRDTTRTRVTQAGTKFTFKDAIPPFTGHAVCSSSEWINGLSNPTGESYHPNRTGHSSGYLPLARSVLG